MLVSRNTRITRLIIKKNIVMLGNVRIQHLKRVLEIKNQPLYK